MFTKGYAHHAVTGFARDARSVCKKMNPSVRAVDRTSLRSCTHRTTRETVQTADNHCMSWMKNARSADSSSARTVLRQSAVKILLAQNVVLSSSLSALNVVTPLELKTNFAPLVELRFRTAPPLLLQKAGLPRAWLSRRQPGFPQSSLRCVRSLDPEPDRDRPLNHGR